MNVLLRLYVNALLRGNPFVVIPTMLVAAAIGVPFLYDGLSQRDPVAVGVVVVITLMFLVLRAVGVVDRKLNPETKPKPRPKQGAGTASRADRR